MIPEFNRRFICPWCGKGEVLASPKARGRISVRCNKGPHTFICDLDNGTTERAQAIKRLGRKK